MSKYKRIETEFRNVESLKKALDDLSLPYELSPNVLVPSLRLHGYNDEQGELVSIMIPKSKTGGYEDVGFAWDQTKKRFEAHISTHDYDITGHRDVGEPTLNRIKQRYAFHEVNRQAHAMGYSIREQSIQDGTIRLICTKW